MPRDSKALLMIGVSYMEPVFEPEICIFRLVFLFENLCVGQDDTKRCVATGLNATLTTRCNAVHVEGMGWLSMPHLVVWGTSPKNFFSNKTSHKGI